MSGAAPASPRLRAVLTGRVQPLGRTLSAIDKHAVAGAQAVQRLGLAGDAQADRRVHGGEGKAVHCYAWSHYAAWRAALPGCALFDRPGAFGENLSIDGLDEHSVCIGERWRVGSALLEVSQGRQPCYKLNLRFGVADMALRVQQSGRAGWYLRVLESGLLTAGDRIERVACPYPDYSIARLLGLIQARETRAELLAPVLDLPLPPSWRRLFEQRLHSGRSEDWQRRLHGD